MSLPTDAFKKWQKRGLAPAADAVKGCRGAGADPERQGTAWTDLQSSTGPTRGDRKWLPVNIHTNIVTS